MRAVSLRVIAELHEEGRGSWFSEEPSPPGWSVLKLSLIDQRISMQSVLFAARRCNHGLRVLRSRPPIWGNRDDQRKTVQDIRCRVQATRIVE